MTGSREASVLTSRDGDIGLVTLNRPARANAFDHQMLDEWVKALREFRLDDDVKVIVVTGAGTAFCGGVDLAELNPDEEEYDFLHRLRDGAHRVAREVFLVEKPIIAAINGPAVGAGFDMALLCDIRIASDDTRIGANYIKRGLFPGNGATYQLPKLVGVSRALEMLWTGGMMTGRRALELGIISHTYPQAEVLARSHELAREIAGMDPVLVSAIKRSVYAIAPLTREHAFNVVASEAASVRGLPGTRANLRAVKQAKSKRETAPS